MANTPTSCAKYMPGRRRSLSVRLAAVVHRLRTNPARTVSQVRTRSMREQGMHAPVIIHRLKSNGLKICVRYYNCHANESDPRGLRDAHHLTSLNAMVLRGDGENNRLTCNREETGLMCILIVNDGGISSSGTATLDEAATHSGEVRVVAPDVEQAWAGHSIAAWRPLSYKRTPIGNFEAYRVNGTPADCVALGAYHWEKVD